MKRPDDVKVGDKFILTEDVFGYKKGELLTLTRDDGSDCPGFSSQHGFAGYVHFRRLEKATGLDAVRVGDVLVYYTGAEKMVLATLGRNYLLSNYNDFDRVCNFYSQKELVEHGYSIKGGENKQTIEVGGHVYDKKEFEDAVKDLREVK